MAGNAAWGIDLGQCALKAVRCTLSEDGQTLVADAFDYIEYPKILSQPDANPDELIAEALQQFLSRNEVKGDRVAIAVSGQAGLARFIKLPPVDSSKIPDIVKYEARQQIPFPLEEVVWDYQQLAGGTEEDGFALETEVGLFAMKRDQVFKAIKPYDDAGMELDVIQLAPLAIYNMACFDLLTDLPPPDQYDADKPPESLVILSMGTETSDLVITNGYRVWQRSIPIGGNHFTRQLTKDMKLTFAKAEHLKRNARQSEDPKAVFQAMRPVFSDLVTEVQRSIGYFRSLDRTARIGRLLVLGNTVKLPGLAPYLGKNLDTEILSLEEYRQLAGPGVVGSPTFKENAAAFGVAYGLALQALGKAKLATSLLPREILINRLVKEKKPWAAAAVGAILLGLAMWFALSWQRAYTAAPTRVGSDGMTTWQAAQSAAESTKSTSAGFVQRDEELLTKFSRLKSLGQGINQTAEHRLLWLELLTAINAGLPYDEEFGRDTIPKKPIEERRQLHLTRIDAEFFPDLKLWYNQTVKQEYTNQKSQIVGAPPAATANGAAASQPTNGSEAAPAEGGESDGPEGEGWVVEIEGYHLYKNTDAKLGQTNFLRTTLLKHLHVGQIDLPVGGGKSMRWSVQELGISYPVQTYSPQIDRSYRLKNPDWDPSDGAENDSGAPSDQLIVPRLDFRIQFVWQETPLSERLERRAEEERKKAEEAAAQAEQAGENP